MELLTIPTNLNTISIVAAYKPPSLNANLLEVDLLTFTSCIGYDIKHDIERFLKILLVFALHAPERFVLATHVSNALG